MRNWGFPGGRLPLDSPPGEERTTNGRINTMGRWTVKRFALLCAAVVLVGGVVGILFHGEQARERRVSIRAGEGSPLVHAPMRQSAGVRRWREQAYHLSYVMSAGSGGPLAMPLVAKTDAAGNLLVLDWAEQRIKKFDGCGNFLAVFGKGKGAQEGEFSNLTDFDTAPDGSVWACDPVNGRVTVFSSSGDVLTSLRPGSSPYRIALLPSGGCVVMSSPIGGELLTVLAGDGTVVRRCGMFLRDQKRLGVVLDGRLAALPTGGVAYAGYRSGLIAVYDHRGDSLAIVRETVEHGGFPDVVLRETAGGELARVDPAAPLVTRSISTVGEELHLLTDVRPAEGGRVFDVYDTRGGEYTYSYRFPGEAASACVTARRVYAVADTAVLVWDRER